MKPLEALDKIVDAVLKYKPPKKKKKKPKPRERGCSKKNQD